jgi:hypothetical protein
MIICEIISLFEMQESGGVEAGLKAARLCP